MLLASLVTVLIACVIAQPVSRMTGRSAGWILALPLLVATVMLVVLAEGVRGDTVTESYRWMPTIDVGLSLRMDGLSFLFALIVLIIGAGILAYSARYLRRSGSHASFYALMTAFAASMLILVLADDLIVMFIAWEATTLCSFFLIARSGVHGREPAIRTLLVTAAGGLLLLAAVIYVAVTTGTTVISEALVSSAWSDDPGFAAVAAVLLAAAAFTKSAQFPFQSWLPDSMVAISPVSAYLHAAAMVKAGIYLLLRFSPALSGHAVWMILLITSGLITAVFGAAAALRRHDLKELLAYSTMSQLGLLVAMIGVGTPAALTAATIHTVAHALFKSALFMLVGVIDHKAGTRDIRELAAVRLRMPFTAAAVALAAASMAGIPLLLGFVSKELMFGAFLSVPGPAWVAGGVTSLGAITAVLTFAYSGRLVLGAFAGRSGRTVEEASPLFFGVPAVAALSGLAFGLFPFVLDPLVGGSATASIGTPVDAHLALWHGFNAALAVSAAVISLGVLLIVFRNRVAQLLAPLDMPYSGLDVVDALRSGTITFGSWIGRLTGSRAPRLHLAIPVVCVTLIAIGAIGFIGELPAVVGNPSRPLDWVLVALIGIGVIAAMRARSRVSAIVVTGVVGFTMTLWFFVLGAADVALTQLLVEILTVCVMVLLLRRLPARFRTPSWKRRLPAFVIASAAGLAATVGVWALTGRREMSAAAEYFLREGKEQTGGDNIVNTILVDFRALDTLGELTVLGVAGVAVAALLQFRRPTPTRSARLRRDSPLTDPEANSVFARFVTRVIGPGIVVISLILLFRGHYEPGGGFIAALVGGAGFALLYLVAPSDDAARIRGPYLALIGAGVAVGAGTGFIGYLHGSFLTPIHFEVLGLSLTTALIFDIGVYLAVIGIVLASLNLLGLRQEGGMSRTAKERVSS